MLDGRVPGASPKEKNDDDLRGQPQAYTGFWLAAWISSNFATATYSETTNSLSVASPTKPFSIGPSFVFGGQRSLSSSA